QQGGLCQDDQTIRRVPGRGRPQVLASGRHARGLVRPSLDRGTCNDRTQSSSLVWEMTPGGDTILAAERVARSMPRTEFEQLRQSFAETGFAIIRDVVPREWLSQLQARILEEFERIKKDGRLFSGGGTMTGHLNCFPGTESRFAYQVLE